MNKDLKKKTTLADMAFLKKSYKEYIRDDFINAFKKFYCDGNMNVPIFDNLKSDCNHYKSNKTKTKMDHYELVVYAKNILFWLDPKMGYDNCKEVPKPTKQRFFKTSYFQEGEQLSRVCLYYRLPDFNNKIIDKQLSKKIDLSCDFPPKNVKADNASETIIYSPDKPIKKKTKNKVKSNNGSCNLSKKSLSTPEVDMIIDSKKELNKNVITPLTSSGSNKKSLHNPKTEIPNKVEDPNLELNKKVGLPTTSKNLNDKRPHSPKAEINTVNHIEILLKEKNCPPTISKDLNKKRPHGSEAEIDTVNNKEILLKEENCTPTCSKDLNQNRPLGKAETDTVIIKEILLKEKNSTLISSNQLNKKRPQEEEIDTVNNKEMLVKEKNCTLTLNDLNKKSLCGVAEEIDMVNDPGIMANSRKSTLTKSKDLKKSVPSSKSKIHTIFQNFVCSPTYNDCTLSDDSPKNNSNIPTEKSTNIVCTSKKSIKANIGVQNTSSKNTIERVKKISEANQTFEEKELSKSVLKSKNSEIIPNCLFYKTPSTKNITLSNKKNSKQPVESNSRSKECGNISLTGKRCNSNNDLDTIVTNKKLKTESKEILSHSSNKIKDINDIKNENHYEAEKNLPGRQNDDEIKKSHNSKKTLITTTKKNMNEIAKAVKNDNQFNLENSSPKDNTPNKNIIQKIDVQKTQIDSTKKPYKNMYTRNSKGETILHTACSKGNLDTVISLLSQGFNPNVKDHAGWTPLHETVKTGRIDIVKSLIKYGAYLSVPGFEYETPLHTAIKYNQFEIAEILLENRANTKCVNIYGETPKTLNEEIWSKLTIKKNLCTPKFDHVYEPDQVTIIVNGITLNNGTINRFCKQFNIKLAKTSFNDKHYVTHVIVPDTPNNICNVNFECLNGIANGLFIIKQKWITNSLLQNKLLSCEDYEVSGTKQFVDCNGPKLSRINKQNLNPKLFDGINVHICGNSGFNQLTVEDLKKLVLEFGAKLLKRMPNPEDCSTNIMPFHCQKYEQMQYLSTIILYTNDSNRLIKYNMKHFKAFHISWFLEVAQKYSIV
ncbi:ankyrin repeat domain-containing protein 31-like isoform X2 [Adelges cooleyi]|uniref:ankyrin repeat domain-containing protein 31-like isoform X2 n=1 Tax=Adelges cooleyi TaxID=133065 RepID=UPI0021801FC8|nr:ankyrin repeat domain-containing protein 31-like isoform X2 [Adelges cooleyi]